MNHFWKVKSNPNFEGILLWVFQIALRDGGGVGGIPPRPSVIFYRVVETLGGVILTIWTFFKT